MRVESGGYDYGGGGELWTGASCRGSSMGTNSIWWNLITEGRKSDQGTIEEILCDLDKGRLGRVEVNRESGGGVSTRICGAF